MLCDFELLLLGVLLPIPLDDDGKEDLFPFPLPLPLFDDRELTLLLIVVEPKVMRERA